jgi:hypothetical protein
MCLCFTLEVQHSEKNMQTKGRSKSKGVSVTSFHEVA